jgi:hypothetical protein
MSDDNTYPHLVELTCRHLALFEVVPWADIVGATSNCEVCDTHRTIVRNLDDR